MQCSTYYEKKLKLKKKMFFKSTLWQLFLSDTRERQRSGETESPFQTRIIEDSESAFQRKFIYNVFHLHICVQTQKISIGFVKKFLKCYKIGTYYIPQKYLTLTISNVMQMMSALNLHMNFENVFQKMKKKVHKYFLLKLHMQISFFFYNFCKK